MGGKNELQLVSGGGGGGISLLAETSCSPSYPPKTKKLLQGTKNMQGRHHKQSLKDQSDLSQATNFMQAAKGKGLHIKERKRNGFVIETFFEVKEKNHLFPLFKPTAGRGGGISIETTSLILSGGGD